MNRTARTLAALGFTVTAALLGGAGIAGAQEMEHGRPRPAARSVQPNQVKTQDATMAGYAGYIRA